MNEINTGYNQIWVAQDKLMLNRERGLSIPNGNLENTPWVEVVDEDSLNEIPDEGGCYWIWTNEEIRHKLHKNHIPDIHNNGRIIYNGIAKDNIRDRIRKHLFSYEHEGWSAISVDIYKHPSKSHRKKAMSTVKRAKVAFTLNNNRIITKEQLLLLNLDDGEIEYINSKNRKNYFFKNGIKRTDGKHAANSFVVYFIVGLQSVTYLEFVEKEWRHLNGMPQLCSYLSGR